MDFHFNITVGDSAQLQESRRRHEAWKQDPKPEPQMEHDPQYWALFHPEDENPEQRAFEAQYHDRFWTLVTYYHQELLRPLDDELYARTVGVIPHYRDTGISREQWQQEVARASQERQREFELLHAMTKPQAEALARRRLSEQLAQEAGFHAKA